MLPLHMELKALSLKKILRRGKSEAYDFFYQQSEAYDKSGDLVFPNACMF